MEYCRNILALAILSALICPFLPIAAADTASDVTTVTAEPMKSTAFKFIIRNDNPEKTVYTMFIKGVNLWLVLTDSQLVINPGETRKATIVAFPDSSIRGKFPIEVVAQSRFDTLVNKFEINVPALMSASQLQSNINYATFDDRGFRISLYCAEPLNLTISIFKEGIPVDEYSEILGAGERIIERKLNFGYGKYTVSYRVFRGDELLFSGNRAYEKVYTSGIKSQESTEDSFLWSVTTVSIFNEGSRAEMATFDLELENYVEPFLSSSEGFSKTARNSSIVNHWEFYLESGQAKTFTYTYNYTYGFLLAFVIVVGIVALYYLLNRGIHLKKSVTGGRSGIKSEFELKVYLEVSNKTGRKVKDLTLEDYVQPIFRIKKNFTGIAPTGFFRKGDDVKIVWKVPSIDPKESRVFTYTVVPKVGLKGKYKFSNAKLSYRIGSFKKEVISNEAHTGK